MRSSLLASLTLMTMTAVLSSPASAQTINGIMYPGGPPISPYLNLLRFGSLPAINYYNLVEPQMQFQSAITGLQQNQANLTQALTTSGAQATPFVTTGHPATFVNYSHYYSFGGASRAGSIGGIGGIGGAGGLGAMGGVGQLPGQTSPTSQGSTYSPIQGMGGLAAFFRQTPPRSIALKSGVLPDSIKMSHEDFAHHQTRAVQPALHGWYAQVEQIADLGIA